MSSTSGLGPRRGSFTSLRQVQERTSSLIATKLFFLALVTTVFMVVLFLRFVAQGGGEPPVLVRAGDLQCPVCDNSTGSLPAGTLAAEAWELPQLGEQQRHLRRRRDPNTLPQQLYQAVHLDPTLARDPAVAAAFLPTPWLLPAAAATQENLPYLGLHNDLEALLKLRAAPLGGQEKAARGVSVVYFSGSHAVMLQNFVYTAVKWGGITNYIVATWGESSLTACIAMRLPCFNATDFSPLPIADGEMLWRSKGFIPLSWIKPRVATAIVSRGYHVHSSDVDIAFPPKAFWPSMMRFLEFPGADVAMERDLWGPINTGCVVVRPNKYGKAFMEAWSGRAKEDAEAGVDDQERVMQLGQSVFQTCQGPWDCAAMKAERAKQAKAARRKGEQAPRWALLRRYHPAWDMLWQDHCTAGHTDWGSHIDPCMPPNPPYHAVCVTGSDAKIRGFKATGLWFLDEEGTEGCTRPPEGQRDGAGGADEAAVKAFAASFIEAAAAERRGLSEAEVAALEQQQQQAPQAEGQQGGEGEQQAGSSGSGGGSRGRRQTLQVRQEALQALGQQGQQQDLKAEVAPWGVPVKEAEQRQQDKEEEVVLWEEPAKDAGEHQQQHQQQQRQDAATPRCRPLAWRRPRAEDNFLACDKSQLAWVYYSPSIGGG